MMSSSYGQVTSQPFRKLIDQLNINERNICLTYTYDKAQISFLDLKIGLENGKISTCTFRKRDSG